MSEDDNRVVPLKKRAMGLGRGLSALLGEIEQEQPVGGDAVPAQGIMMVPTADLSPMKGQPRKHFDEAALEELAQSIAARGLLQPIVVRTDCGWRTALARGAARAASPCPSNPQGI
jgi:ParB family transcriptional regulator, chromosome partitioning protein